MNYSAILYDMIGTEIELMTQVVVDMSNSVYKKTKWKVVEAYPHHILCERTSENGTIIRESFDVGTLIQKGILKGGR